MIDLKNKKAIVTGASRGIGRATAIALASAGAYVIVHYGKSKQEAETVAAEIRNTGGKADIAGADLVNPDAASELAEQLRNLIGDKLDVFVANAGISKAARIEDHTLADFDSLFATNVRAPFFLLQQFLPLLAEGSSVIVTTSLAARVRQVRLDSLVHLRCPPTRQPKAPSKLWSNTGPPC